MTRRYNRIDSYAVPGAENKIDQSVRSRIEDTFSEDDVEDSWLATDTANSRCSFLDNRSFESIDGRTCSRFSILCNSQENFSQGFENIRAAMSAVSSSSSSKSRSRNDSTSSEYSTAAAIIGKLKEINDIILPPIPKKSDRCKAEI
mmetsp:Transcript_24029/g.35140  ORF Transcript_24029/g.35140 Transcript_24029/m.35140 type:complete len:146 (+) Transcript_24029:139-576(+)|eukprot:CAMPEP_0195517364 /NCGR_PEP_ID=MMETSP0794_2-20130614/10560_1 /TAXON_ID=515487 /ORGANISM="Stephanopyxis turris, Strain CCMP 815" /LENGTH=145 /DNA_ID=CAMNT_0040646155 /DNA_START=133 /DNA_END=570 /DNA_ORIENTATION=-